jgi:peroxiredoxin
VRSSLWPLLCGVAALFVVASYFGHFVYVPGAYRTLPWAHLAALPTLAALSVWLARRARRLGWVGVIAAAVATLILWGSVFVGTRLPAHTGALPAVAPEFVLPDQDGDVVRLADLREQGPVVVAFFRGGYDTYARPALADLGRVSADAAVVAISGDPVGELAALRRRVGVRYGLLSDADLATARAFGVLDETARAPHPAVFVVASDGRITWARVLRSSLDLPDPDAIRTAVRAARAPAPAPSAPSRR